jgi:hypothetical protein
VKFDVYLAIDPTREWPDSRSSRIIPRVGRMEGWVVPKSDWKWWQREVDAYTRIGLHTF